MDDRFHNLTEEQLRTAAVVLSAAGITYDFAKEKHGWDLVVSPADRERAAEAIAVFLAENENRRQKQTAARDGYQKTTTGLWVALLLLAVHVVTNRGLGEQALIFRYGASAEAILSGQYYRSVTALMVHVDGLHLVGNMLGVALFGTAVCSVTGWGVGWLIILISGAAGNFLNALFYRGHHLSIGASTAVFGAVGFLAMHQFVRRYRTPGSRLSAWIPLGAGLALLGILGTAPRVDLGAHLFGFGSGVVLAMLYALLKLRAPTTPYQTLCLLTAFGIQLFCWWVGAAGP